MKKIDNSNDFKIKFYPEEEKDYNQIIEEIKTFGKIYNEDDIFEDSLIIDNNSLYINNLITWINSKKKIKTELLYRKTRDGDSYDTFHRLCDNQGTTLVLIKSSEGFIIGGYTPLSWDNCTEGWKSDHNTFLFNLTQNKIFRKKSQSNVYSIYCDKTVGAWFAYIGFRDSGKKNMSQGEFIYISKNEEYFENFNDIIPNEGKSKFFKTEEVEIYKILFT